MVITISLSAGCMCCQPILAPLYRRVLAELVKESAHAPCPATKNSTVLQSLKPVRHWRIVRKKSDVGHPSDFNSLPVDEF